MLPFFRRPLGILSLAFGLLIMGGSAAEAQTNPLCQTRGHGPTICPDLGSSGGDVFNPYYSPRVRAIQGAPVSPLAPLLNQALLWNGSQYVPTPVVTPGNGSGTDFSVNDAGVDFFQGYFVLHNGARVNAAGAYTGGGVGNKSLRGVMGLNGLPLSSLTSISFTWQNIVGTGGAYYNPPGPVSSSVPYINVLVDFGGGNVRFLSIMDSSLGANVTPAVGTYSNPGGLNTLTYSWANTKDVLVVNSPPLPVPGGVLPDAVDAPGTIWQQNAYKFSDLVAANPGAVLIDTFPNDGGMPAGAIVPAMMLASGDSNTVIRSGKKFLQFLVNGLSVM